MNNGTQHQVLCNWGSTLKQSSAVHIQASYSADVILLGSSSKLRLLVINLASVPGGQLVNSPTAQSLDRYLQCYTMTDFKVIIPDEHYQVLNFVQDDLPGIAIINSALKTFQPKEVFNWHLSIMLDFEDIVDNGMPSKNEQHVIDKFGDFLDASIKGKDTNKPNALFLARITWNKTRELIWRVYDPKESYRFLKQIISDNSSPRPFDYRMEADNEWKLAEWHLKH